MKENKNKCIFIYKDKIFPLQEYFSKTDIKEETDKLKILMIQFNDISDKNFIFHEYNLLIQTNKENIKELNNNIYKDEKEEEKIE